MKGKPWAVLGCGPSGLMAAHALASYGQEFIIISKREMSTLGGAQFCHIPIPGITDGETPEAILTYRVTGDAETYNWKVYRGAEVPFVSFDNIYPGKQVPAWSLREIYKVLWDRYKDRIMDIEVTPEFAYNLSMAFRVVSSIPAPAICWGSSPNGEPGAYTDHSFRSVSVLIVNDAGSEVPDNEVWYDGSDKRSYYRTSRIFGVPSTEWGTDAALPPMMARTVRKPIETGCDCHPYILKVGRYGRWRKGVLTHHAYEAVVDLLEEERA